MTVGGLAMARPGPDRQRRSLAGSHPPWPGMTAPQPCHVVADTGVGDAGVVLVEEPFPELPDGQGGVGGEYGDDGVVQLVEGRGPQDRLFGGDGQRSSRAP